MRHWTFITHHAAILVLMTLNARITAREISARVGVTERTVRTIISDLEREKYITKKHEGRTVCYTVNPDRNLRHSLQNDKTVGQLLSVLGGLPFLPAEADQPCP